MEQTNRHRHQPSSNGLRSLNDNLDENIQRNQQDISLDDAGATPVINEQQTASKGPVVQQKNDEA
jgi:hypothetical protein